MVEQQLAFLLGVFEVTAGCREFLMVLLGLLQKLLFVRFQSGEQVGLALFFEDEFFEFFLRLVKLVEQQLAFLLGVFEVAASCREFLTVLLDTCLKSVFSASNWSI
ncbi:hypothetical protein ACE0DR_24830 [Azotobacter sp. CWF10]